MFSLAPPFARRALSCLGYGAALVLSGAALADDDALELGSVEVTAAGLAPNEEQASRAREALHRLPGASNYVDLQQVGEGRSSTNADVFRLQPGVYAQATNNEGIKLSIRGSGLNRGPGAHASGLYETFDGLPLTGPGGTPYELKEPLWASGVEVLRGANGFDRGALALGGAVNYISRTGLDAPLLGVHYEAGSKGYAKREISSGQVLGDADYFVSLTDSASDGEREHSGGSGQGVAANFGYRFSPELETRFYFRYRETDNDMPGNLTRAQIEHNPHVANAGYLARDAKRIEPGSTWLANKTTWRFADNQRLEAGLAYHDYPMDLREGTNRIKVAYTDVSGVLNYVRDDEFAGRTSQTTLGLRTTQAMPNSGASEYVRTPAGNTAGYAPGTTTRHYSYLGSDSVLHLGNELQLADDLWLTSGIAAIYTRRQSDVTYPQGGGSVSQHAWDYAARLGLRWQLSPGLELYGNLSRSVEPPHAWSLLWSSNRYFTSGPARGLARQGIDLKNQSATTLEVGGRGDSPLGAWSAAVYRSEVRHELLSVETQAATPTTSQVVAEVNASPTVHQGVELGLETPLWEGGAAGKLALTQAFTYSDFHYRDDGRFGSNALPGIPRQYYQAELRYSLPEGWYAAVNTERAGRRAVDYANSYYTRAYALYGARLGYASPRQAWSGWVDLRNLTNERYAATVSPGYDDKGADVARSFPGEGRGVFVGVSYAWR
ncbi:MULTISPECIES: TonB-dependent receptor domain-containing protein [unclassified Pseudomonas]|uniref:TonB-dependent receptor family protein n=1 Tax=unclassified Pseudomonas TaxID=196821 RepID=UPI000BC8E40C|nr:MULTISPECIES: TonB-dependent receptor [unclassified Pseudomonas]PVZ16481.1 iron complex outermembrane receptor protein [Pseudomonas sp. URIL14HWK12:I12]PVZ25663.1 iron complex outermembrane receptor protein [Pseudomonas sp. URIL14HWK12:I10]PVZ36813.1 iron complex outermembrane receptor protein [Pseudomonas sp. URIL14HWK12:I11]SNZ12562.1 iron complex outermembrane recepter protein [Pseudomonas sp. URIL14HWK12:I9]